MERIPTTSTHGYHPLRLSSHPQAHGVSVRRRRAVVIDISEIVKAMSRDRALWVLRDMMPIKEAIDYLIEETMVPKETMTLMEDICRYIDRHSDIRALFDEEEDFTVLELQLESYQRMIDDKIILGMDGCDATFRYVVNQWLGDTSLVVSADPITKDQHDASKNYPYSTSLEPRNVSSILRLL